MTPKLWGVLGLAAAAVALAWVFRYETIPVEGNPVGYAYLVNRWTGTAYMIRGSGVHEVETPIQVEARRNAAIDRFLDEDLPAKTTGGPGSKGPNPFDQFDR